MTVKYKTKGFVFKKMETLESDQVFSVFTKDFGRLELKAKAIRKITSKLRSGIDIFYLSEVEFIQGKNNKTLTSAEKIKKFDEIILDFQKMKVACQVMELLDSFIKGQEKDEEIFYLLNDFFENLKGNIKNHQLAFQYFFWNFVSLQGYHLQMQDCSDCREKLVPYDLYFCAKEGGVVCQKCSALGNKQKINSDVVKVLRLILNKDWQTISKLKIEPSSQKILEDISESALQTFCPS
jgi:DNA repair protein RecO (recombination protein O)